MTPLHYSRISISLTRTIRKGRDLRLLIDLPCRRSEPCPPIMYQDLPVLFRKGEHFDMWWLMVMLNRTGSMRTKWSCHHPLHNATNVPASSFTVSEGNLRFITSCLLTDRGDNLSSSPWLPVYEQDTCGSSSKEAGAHVRVVLHVRTNDNPFGDDMYASGAFILRCSMLYRYV